MHSGIRPNETSSPAPRKKATKRHQIVEGTVKVEELTDTDAGYIADIEVVYPHELEEAEDSCLSGEEGFVKGYGSVAQVEEDDDDSDDAPSSVAEQFSRLGCADTDDAEAEFEKKRREKHIRRRAESRVFKRPHSLIINPDVEVADSEAMADHDLPMSARRLRRRVEGPDEDVSDVPMSPADSAMVSPAAEKKGQMHRSDGIVEDAVGGNDGNEDMDVDDSE